MSREAIAALAGLSYAQTAEVMLRSAATPDPAERPACASRLLSFSRTLLTPLSLDSQWLLECSRADARVQDRPPTARAVVRTVLAGTDQHLTGSGNFRLYRFPRRSLRG